MTDIEMLPDAWVTALTTVASNDVDVRDMVVQCLERARNNSTRTGRKLVPLPHHIFRAFHLTSPQSVSVIILGKEPACHPGHANGLAFAVGSPDTGYIYPSRTFLNIVREVQSDVGHAMSADLDSGEPSGDLAGWARQGVLLVHNVWTTELRSPNAHGDGVCGWEDLTDLLLRWAVHRAQTEPMVIITFGRAPERALMAMEGEDEKLLLIKCGHPCPVSAHLGFFRSRPFSRANSFLPQEKRINWLELE